MTEWTKIVLRSFRDPDLELLNKWLHAPHVAPWYEHPEAWLHEVRKRDGTFLWIHHFIILADQVPVGFCQYYPYWKSGEDWNGTICTAGTYSIDYLVGEAAYLKTGCGREAVKKLLELIQAEPDAKRIIVQPDEDNEASRNTLESAGLAYDKDNQLYLKEF